MNDWKLIELYSKQQNCPLKNRMKELFNCDNIQPKFVNNIKCD